MKTMSNRRKQIFALSLSFVFVLSGCMSGKPRFDQSESSSQHTERSNIDISGSESKGNYDYSLLPDFLYGYFDYGVYETPIRIPNSEHYDEIRISEANKIVIPELSVLTVCMHKWGESPCLMKQDDAKITQIFDCLKKEDATVANDTFLSDKRKESEQDGEITFVVLKADSKYATLSLDSYKDHSIFVSINQEDKNELQVVVNSEIIHKCIRELCEVKEGDIKLLLSAEKIEYKNISGDTICLSQQQINEMKALAENLSIEKNYSSGCPFDLKMVFESNGNKFNAYYSTDSCGILIIEDKTFKLDENSRKIMKNMFHDIDWHDK